MPDIVEETTGAASLQALLARHVDWWHRKGCLYAAVPHSPLSDLWLPLSNGTLATEDMTIEPADLDLDRLVGPPLEAGPLERVGDRLSARAPYSRIPWVEAILGCPIKATIQGGSMRTHSFISDWSEWEKQAVHLDDRWFDTLKQLTGMLVARSGGRYAVVQTLMRGPSDLAEAVLGPELMCLSMYDHPESLRRFLDQVTSVFIKLLKAQLERIPLIQGGYVNPFGVWAPGTVVRTQCDASAFLSPSQYQEWFLPYDVRISEAVDYAIIHLHSGSLHTVDVLLEEERPQAIQISLDPPPTGPPVETIIPIFVKILGHKSLIVDGYLTPDQVDHLQQCLPPDGRYIIAREEPW